ncbi:MAG: aminoglycoside 6-N-acetyltransferase [Thermoleophilaceae bacterium]|nr:aminoglycoside 6-N-acetyltransferase [Thermoleophilaceae bacterium]
MSGRSPFRGERLVLEPLRPEHAERLREMRRTPEVERWWHPAEPDWPLDPQDDVDERFVIVVGGQVAGFLQFAEERDPDARHADVDIFLAPEHQGRGLGGEALLMLVRHLSEERGHHRVTLSTSPENARAIRAYEKAGFRRIGVTHKSERNPVTGEWQDELLMELVA